jgi:ubiquinone/menaquinone biosynthesis C-methylase UbiE
MTDEGFDKERAKRFLDQMVGIMNGGAMALMCSLGHRTRLFDVLADLPPSTSAEIAAAAGLSERPVREWLNAVTVGGIVDHDPETGHYRLPKEHSGLLTRAAGTLNLANGLQFIGQMGRVEDDVLEAFRTGEGVPYTAYSSFHRLMAEVSGQRFEHGLVQHVVPTVPGLADALAAGVDVADVGCGSGRAVLILAAAFPASRFRGIDISEHTIGLATSHAAEEGLTNASFSVADGTALDLFEHFDVVTTFDAIHDQAHPDLAFGSIFAALRPGGRYLCVEPNASSHVHHNHDRPHAPFLYSVSTMHCMQVSLAAGGEGAGAAWGREQIEARLSGAGFTEIDRINIPTDRTNDYWLSRKPA